MMRTPSRATRSPARAAFHKPTSAGAQHPGRWGFEALRVPFVSRKSCGCLDPGDLIKRPRGRVTHGDRSCGESRPKVRGVASVSGALPKRGVVSRKSCGCLDSGDLIEGPRGRVTHGYSRRQPRLDDGSERYKMSPGAAKRALNANGDASVSGALPKGRLDRELEHRAAEGHHATGHAISGAHQIACSCCRR
jgi:hypothetical protein